MKKDIEYLDKIMNIKSISTMFENYFSWIYLFTNENISGFYKKLDFNKKNILTVTGSGDHALNAYLSGANTVESFDMNLISKHISELKIAAIKSISREDFIIFFTRFINKYRSNKRFFNHDIYFTKIRNNLKEEYLEFWDYFFNKYNKEEIIGSLLFSDDCLPLDGIIGVNDYLKNDENYYKLRKIMLNKEIIYYDMDIKELPKINKKYDLVILSNIASYLDDIYKSDYLENFKKLIDSIKKENTRIVVCYLYYNCIKFSADYIYDRYEVDKIFEPNEYEYINFKSTEKYHSPYLILKDRRKDAILVSKNKKEEI